MKKPFFARYALVILMAVFFLAPFALRGARMAVARMKNDVKDWLPADFQETVELDWFRERFLGEQFVVVSWEGCTGSADDEAFKTFVDKLFPEVPPSEKLRRVMLPAEDAEVEDSEVARVTGNWPVEVRRKDYIDEDLGMYVRQLKLGDLPPAQERVGNQLGLHFEPNDLTNWGGKEEKWIRGRGDQWYYITPEGNLYRWKGGSSVIQPLISTFKRHLLKSELEGELIASFGPQDGPWYYESPKRLSAWLFKTVTTGPGVLHQLTKPGGVLAGEEAIALERLRGTLFGPDGKQTCLVITLTDAAKADLRIALGRGILGKPQGELLTLAAEAGIHPPAAPTLAPPPISWFLAEAPPPTGPVIRLGGPSVDNVAIDEEGQITLVRLVGLSLFVGIGLSYMSFRSVNITIMLFLVGGLSAVASLSFVYWSGMTVDAVLMSMPSLVYVLGLSGAVHIVNYYRDCVAHGGIRRAPGAAVALGWKPCTLAAITTAIGLMSLYSSNILPIRKFGLFSAIGVVATLALLFTYLPSALQTWPPKRFRNRKPGKPIKSNLEQFIGSFWRSVGTVILKYWGVTMAACFVAMIGVGFGLRQINTDVQLLKMFDANSKIIRDYRWLEEHLGRLVPMEVVVRVDEQHLRHAADRDDQTETAADDDRERLLGYSFLERMEIANNIQKALEYRFGDRGAGLIGHAMSAVTFSVELPGAGGSSFDVGKRGGISRALEGHRAEFLASEYLRVDPVDQAELWRISLRLGALNDVDYGQFVGDLKQTIEPVLAAYETRNQILRKIQERQGLDHLGNTKVFLAGVPFGRSRTAQTPLPESPADASVPAAEREAEEAEEAQTLIFSNVLYSLLVNARLHVVDWHDPRFQLPESWPKAATNQDLVVVVNPEVPYDLGALRQADTMVVDARDHRYHAGEPTAAEQDEVVSAIYTGLVPVVYKAQRTLLDSLVKSTVWAFVMIAVVMIFVVRSVRAGLLSMLPNIFPVAIVFGTMGWGNILVDIGSMMTASVAMGVAVDDTIHFLTWFRRGLDEGLKRRDSILQAYERVGMAMTQTTAIGGLGLSIFAFSTFTPTQRFGTLMLTLLAAALVGDLIFLPALLASPLGRVFDGPRRSRKKSPAADGTPGSDSQPGGTHKRPYPVSTQRPQNRSINS